MVFGSCMPQKLKLCWSSSASSVLVEDEEEEEEEEGMFLWCFVAIFRPSREVVTALLSMLEGVKSGCFGFGLHCVGLRVIMC
jgi:hypothetical protein